MNINFKMWRTAAWSLVKMEDKARWDALDVISKWLIATRSGVTTVTIYSCIMGGLLAWRDHAFSWLPWIIVTLGLFIAQHSSIRKPADIQVIILRYNLSCYSH